MRCHFDQHSDLLKVTGWGSSRLVHHLDHLPLHDPHSSGSLSLGLVCSPLETDWWHLGSMPWVFFVPSWSWPCLQQVFLKESSNPSLQCLFLTPRSTPCLRCAMPIAFAFRRMVARSLRGFPSTYGFLGLRWKGWWLTSRRYLCQKQYWLHPLNILNSTIWSLHSHVG